MSRQEYNKKIVELLSIYVNICPEQRLGQIFQNYFNPISNTADPFYAESKDIYEYAKNNLERFITLDDSDK